MTPLQLASLSAAAFAAGVVNSIAGGGTLLTFPSLLACGIGPVTANATSTVSLVPGSFAAFWGLQRELQRDRALLATMALPSIGGGLAGALLALRVGDAVFAAVVPWLILGATGLFMANEPLSRWLGRAAGGAEGAVVTTEATEPTPRALALIAVFQCVVGLYGGFFGAGIGILMLAALGLAGMRDIHRMNALKNLAAVCINGVASLTFIVRGRVIWWIVGVMALSAVLGGLLGAAGAKRVGPKIVRRLVVCVGVAIAAVMLARR